MSRFLTSFLCGLVLASAAFVDSAAAQTFRFIAPATTLAPAGGTLPISLRSDVFTLLPDDCLGFVAAHHILDTKRTVENVLRKLTIPFDADNDYDQFSAALEKIKGWDEKGTHVVGFFGDFEKGSPEVAVFVPVTNYKEFVLSIGGDPAVEGPVEFELEKSPKGLVAARGDYAVLVDKSDDAKALLERIVAGKKSPAVVNESLRKWVAGHQVSGVLMQAGARKLLDEAISGLENIQQGLAVPDNAPEATAASVAAAFDAYGSMFRFLRDEATHLAVGSNLDETTGLRLAAEALFRPDGKFAASVKSIPKLPADALNGLPEQDFFVAGAGVVPTEWTEALMNFSLDMYKTMPGKDGAPAMTPEQIAQMRKASMGSMEGLKYFSASFNSQGEGIFGGAAALYKVADADTFVKNNETAMAEIIKIAKQSKSPFLPEQTVERRQIDGLDVLTMTTDMAKMFEQMQQGQPVELSKMMQQVFGNQGKLTAYLTKVDAQTVAMTYDAAVLKRVVADVRDGKRGLAGNVKLQKTAAMLPTDPSWVGYLSVGGMIEFGRKAATAAMAANGQAFPLPIPPFPEAAPIGLAGRANGSAVEGHFIVPMDLMEATRDYTRQVMAVFGGGR